MLDKLKALFSAQAEAAANTSEHALELAAAVMLVEISHADHDTDPRETKAIIDIATRTLHLEEDEARALLEGAQQRHSSAVSLYEFTETLNRRLDKREKTQLIEDCWRVAYADGRIDRYEEHMVRKVAELLYVSHSDFIRAKLRAAGEA